MRNAERVHPLTRNEWRGWLDENHRRSSGVWLITYKKATGKPRVEYEVAVEEALCFGWIDSKPSKLDAERSMLWFAPRKLKSGWSKINKERAQRAIAAGRMHPAGQAVIDQAKSDGSWSKLDAVESLELPSDLVKAFRKHRGAAKNFSAFPRSVKRGILEWILQAKRPETRARRIEETAQLAAQNLRANQWRK